MEHVVMNCSSLRRVTQQDRQGWSLSDKERRCRMCLAGCHECQDHLSNSGGAAHPRRQPALIEGQCSCTSLISRAFPDLWPRGPEISFCHTIDHCRTILYYSILFQDLALHTTIQARRPHRVPDPDTGGCPPSYYLGP
jgi:hypothetical protein